MQKPSSKTQDSKGVREKLLTVAEVADLLGVPITTIYAWRYHGEGPQGYKIGRHVRYRWSSVEACSQLTPISGSHRSVWIVSSVSRDGRDGGWLARWRDPTGKQGRKSFRRKLDAQRWLDQLNADRHRGQYIDPAAGKVLVGSLAATWARGLSQLKPSTAVRYRGIVRVHIVPMWGRWQLAAIGHSDVAAWVASLYEGGLKPGSVRQVHRVLSLIFDVAVLDGRIGRNPAKRVKLPPPGAR